METLLSYLPAQKVASLNLPGKYIYYQILSLNKCKVKVSLTNYIYAEEVVLMIVF